MTLEPVCGRQKRGQVVMQIARTRRVLPQEVIVREHAERVSVTELARYMGVSKPTAYAWCDRGERVAFIAKDEDGCETEFRAGALAFIPLASVPNGRGRPPKWSIQNPLAMIPEALRQAEGDNAEEPA